MINYLSGPFGALGDLLKDINRMSEDKFTVHTEHQVIGVHQWHTFSSFVFY